MKNLTSGGGGGHARSRMIFSLKRFERSEKTQISMRTRAD